MILRSAASVPTQAADAARSLGLQPVCYPFTDTSLTRPAGAVITCGHDVPRTDGVRLVEALRAADVETLAGAVTA